MREQGYDEDKHLHGDFIQLDCTLNLARTFASCFFVGLFYSDFSFCQFRRFSSITMSKKGKSAAKDGEGSSEIRDRSRSPLRRGQDNEEMEALTVTDFQRMMVETMRAQMPTMIIEASKVARASLAADRDDTNRVMAAEMKKMKLSQTDLALATKASVLKSDGNKSQFVHLAATKAKIDAAKAILEDLQLEEEEADSTRYASLGSAIAEMDAAHGLLDGRLDLIQKADASKVGWSAAVHYEKSNGLLLKSDSGKLWEDAEKKVLEAKRSAFKDAKEKSPFRYGPANSGRYSSNQKSKGYAFSI